MSTSHVPTRDWTEDFPHENGKYWNKCVHCEQLFVGHKRRVICKLCFDREASSVESAARKEDGNG